jgi:hypothetical protein
MGQIVKKLSENHTRYIWYPGEKREWVRAGVALGVGALVFGAVLVVTRELVVATSLGAAVTAALAGVNLGRRDFLALHRPADSPGSGSRRSAARQAGRAAVRGLVRGGGAALSAVLVAALPAHGFVADWLLPSVPVLTGAVAHQAGMLYQRSAGSAPALPPVPVAGAGAAELSGWDQERTREWVGSKSDPATTVAVHQPPNTPSSTEAPTSTVD